MEHYEEYDLDDLKDIDPRDILDQAKDHYIVSAEFDINVDLSLRQCHVVIYIDERFINSELTYNKMFDDVHPHHKYLLGQCFSHMEEDGVSELMATYYKGTPQASELITMQHHSHLVKDMEKFLLQHIVYKEGKNAQNQGAVKI